MADDKSKKKARADKSVTQPRARVSVKAKGKASPKDKGEEKRGPGHPPHPDKWTPEYVLLVAKWMHDYVEATPMPMVCEFCFKYKIQQQRISEHPELMFEREMLHAKAATYYATEGDGLGQGGGPRGSFLAKLAANAGPFSLTDKAIVASAEIGNDVAKLPPEEREARIKEILAKVDL